jgi:hypothetical protein
VTHRLKDVLHLVCHRDRGIEIDDAGSALDGMGGAHERLQARVIGGILLQRQEAGGQHVLLVLDLDLEEVEHRKAAEIVCSFAAHLRLWLMARKSG